MGEYKNIGNAQVHAVRAFFFIGGFGSASWAPLVPLLRERLAIGDDVLGMLLLCVGIGSLVTMPLAGALSTRLGCRKVLTVTAVVYVAVLVAICAVDSLLLAVPVILLFGALMGCVDVVINVAAVIVEQGIGRRIMSGTHAFWSIGGFVGAGLYGVWVGAMGLTPMQSTLIAAGVILLFTGLFGSRLIPYGGGGGRLIAIPRGIIVFIGIAAFIAFLSEGAVMDWSGVYLTTVRGFDLALAGVGFSVFSAAMFLMRLLGDAVVQRLGQRRVAVGGALLACAGILLVMFAPVDALPYAGFFAIGIGAANIVPVFFSLMGKQNVMPIGAAVSAVSTMGYLGILAGPAAIGLVSHLVNLQAAFGILAALCLLQACVGMHVFRRIS
ncbi:transporter, major facilitator family protein [Selenomonas sp. oral taxon 137 str. F0430]|uniref:MFS transporter n=1 Tax=Selenomonas sp. oral taxon 137 TaxID=712531 RepID=UPI0001EB265E|nr:MFS transporter [Selenomonas sp. oral taxon 137]EFR41749.1 transporter, major facilitator family protein [Selenomonas sp. oral taxon 137 str. F0430]